MKPSPRRPRAPYITGRPAPKARPTKSGAVKIEIGQTYPLQNAEQAHRDLEARKTTGSTLLIP